MNEIKKSFVRKLDRNPFGRVSKFHQSASINLLLKSRDYKLVWQLFVSHLVFLEFLHRVLTSDASYHRLRNRPNLFFLVGPKTDISILMPQLQSQTEKPNDRSPHHSLMRPRPTSEDRIKTDQHAHQYITICITII